VLGGHLGILEGKGLRQQLKAVVMVVVVVSERVQEAELAG
jgi:hypothetical protein